MSIPARRHLSSTLSTIARTCAVDPPVHTMKKLVTSVILRRSMTSTSIAFFSTANPAIFFAVDLVARVLRAVLVGRGILEILRDRVAGALRFVPCPPSRGAAAPLPATPMSYQYTGRRAALPSVPGRPGRAA